MLTIDLNEQQYKYLFLLLDRELKASGLNALAGVVELHNVLLSAQKKEPPKNEEGTQESVRPNE